MKQLPVFLLLSIFTILSCNNPKSPSPKTNIAKPENKAGNNSDTQNPNNADINNQPQYTNVLDIFQIRDLEESAHKKVGFISLSDIYPLSEHSNSLAIPGFENTGKNNLQYFKLDAKYRKRLLSKTKISETDSVFIYDYAKDVMRSFVVGKLNAIAYLNDYSDVNDCTCSQDYYMIGFEIAKNNLYGLDKDFNDVLVFIGKANPFVRGQMKAIVWQKVKEEKFPLKKSTLTAVQLQDRHIDATNGQAYLYETKTHQIFIRDYTESNNPFEVLDRHLMIIDKQTGHVVNEAMFSDNESMSPAPLNFGINDSNYSGLKEQWTGKLFKDKPEVLFGFDWLSFGCPGIMFVNLRDSYVYINCDSRH
ncbi:hypothetical protein [Flavobacterium sp. 3HN19-14]|uniref:hypothetical protein n=1 Tax=Flavobacterium sp. 3HN19-14 TaxID=3448133 RepID=UPI003EDF44D7